MAKKEKSRELTKAEAFYVERHFQSRSPEQLAGDIGATPMSVQLYLDALKASGYSPPQEDGAAAKALKAAGLELGKNGVVAMTRGGSEKGDELRSDSEGREEYAAKRLKGAVHNIFPDKK